MSQISNSKKRMMLTLSDYNICITSYEVERSYDYSTEPAFNQKRINISAGYGACKVKILGTMYTSTNPAYAFDTKLTSGSSFGIAFDNMVYTNMSLSRYCIKGRNDESIYDVELEFVSSTSTGGPMNV